VRKHPKEKLLTFPDLCSSVFVNRTESVIEEGLWSQ